MLRQQSPGLLILLLRLIAGYPSVEMPHCTRNTVIEGQLQEMNDEGQPLRMSSTMRADLSLHESVCFLIKANRSDISLLHTIELRRLEQQYPISARYQFAIPAISTQCVCDCAGGDQHCLIDNYHYRNCSHGGSICYRTYRAAQSSVGCLSETKSELCCELHIEPYKQWTFQALRLSQPNTVLVFDYRIFELVRSKWKYAGGETVEIGLNRGRVQWDFHSEHGVEMAVAGSRPHRQLEAGIYFSRDDEQVLREGQAVNDLGETSLDKLGWMRKEQGAWNIRKGLVKITDAQHVAVEDCKAQKFKNTFNAEQYVLLGLDDGDDLLHFDLGHPVTNNAWVAMVDARGPRHVRVEHGEGAAIQVAITTRSRPLFLQHSSKFATFNGTIMLDSESNRFLNVSFQAAKGTLIGNIYSGNERKQVEMVFSMSLGGTAPRDVWSVVAVPPTINATRWLCFHPAGDAEGELCDWAAFSAVPLSDYRVPHRWQAGIGQCIGCNERGVENFLLKLDPRQWMNGIGSTSELLAVVLEGLIVVVIGFLIAGIVTKCVIPLLRWTICVPTAPRK